MTNEQVPLYAAITDLDLDAPVELGHGLRLSSTYVFVFSSGTMAFVPPSQPGQHHPGPWVPTASGYAHEARAELYVPADYVKGQLHQMHAARTITGLLRLWVNPAITLVVASPSPFAQIAAGGASKHYAIALQVERRHFALHNTTSVNVPERVQWVKEHWETAVDLQNQSAEFRLSMETFEAAQFNESTAMTLVSLWGALEAMFSPSTAELRFRVSALIAAFLAPAGTARVELQSRVSKLYDKRSAAAHGKPKHQDKDVMETLTSMRRVLLKIIEQRRVPTKEDLNEMLLGGRWE